MQDFFSGLGFRAGMLYGNGMTIFSTNSLSEGAFSHAILDFDGVIADTENVFAEFDCALLNAVLEKAGLDPDLQISYVRGLAGNGGDEKLRIVGQLKGFDPSPYMEDFVRDRTARRGDLFRDFQVSVARGLDEFFGVVRDNFAVATNKKAAKILPDLRVMALPFEFPVLVTCDEGLQKKPAPDVILKAMAELDVDCSVCAYIGDNVIDIQAALAAGIPGIGFVIEGVKDHQDRAQALQDAGASLVTDDFRDLIPYFS